MSRGKSFLIVSLVSLLGVIGADGSLRVLTAVVQTDYIGSHGFDAAAGAVRGLVYLAAAVLGWVAVLRLNYRTSPAAWLSAAASTWIYWLVVHPLGPLSVLSHETALAWMNSFSRGSLMHRVYWENEFQALYWRLLLLQWLVALLVGALASSLIVACTRLPRVAPN
jgi:hypothetical protein